MIDRKIITYQRRAPRIDYSTRQEMEVELRTVYYYSMPGIASSLQNQNVPFAPAVHSVLLYCYFIRFAVVSFSTYTVEWKRSKKNYSFIWKLYCILVLKLLPLMLHFLVLENPPSLLNFTFTHSISAQLSFTFNMLIIT